MTSTPAGWYPDPDRAGTLRWWDGAQWTHDRAPMAQPVAAAPKVAPRTWMWIGGSSAGFLVLAIILGVGQAMVVLAVLAIVVAIIALSSERIRWLRSLPWKVFTLAAGVLLLIGGSAAAAATSPHAPSTLADLSDSTSSPRLSSPTPTPTPTPTPRVTTGETTETVAIPFDRTSQDDAARDAGTTAVIQAGADGTRTITYTVTYVDGIESERVVASDVVSVAPVPEVTAVGTRQPAPAPVVGGGSGGCDSNYTGACVPIASDVDCAGGSGNGPAYVQGPVRIVGSDVYDLDRDGDGIACDR